ncbi:MULTISPECIES: SHOCT domain-containing protein [Kitasatospora]
MRPPGGGDLAGQVLGELGRLVERGVLTPEEFAVVKARLLAG